jgi:putative Holliday junction resolvase
MLEISLPSSIEYLPLVDTVCQAFCHWAGISTHITEEISIAVVEASTNAIVHANKREPSKKIRVIFEKGPSAVTVSVADEGAGFDLEKVQSPVEECNLLKECGRGIYIMRQVMDTVEFGRTKRGGTKVRMTKSLGNGAKHRVLCIDYGEKRLGLALSDELCITAQPFGRIEVEESKDAFEEVRKLAAENCVTEIVVGMPLTLRGEVSHTASKVTAFASKLNQHSGLAVITWDERLSSKESERILIQSGMSREKRKGVIDSVSAAIVLQSYLDARRNK